MSLTPCEGGVEPSWNAIVWVAGVIPPGVSQVPEKVVIGRAVPSETVRDCALFKPVCSKVPSREMPPSKSFALKMMCGSAPASLMLKAAAFAEFGAIRAIAETARHDDIRRFILFSPFEFPAGSPMLPSPDVPAVSNVPQYACQG